MSLTVTYGDTFFDYGADSGFEITWSDLDSFLDAFESHFAIADHSENPGEFTGEENPDPLVDTGIWGGLFGPFSGTQYVLEGEQADFNLGFIIETVDGGYLDYTFFSAPSHTTYGEIASITFGAGLVQDNVTGEYSFAEELVSIDGLDTVGLNGGVDANGDVIDRLTGENDTHNLVTGLQDGDTSALAAILDGQGLLTADSVDLVGLAETTQAELELAA